MTDDPNMQRLRAAFDLLILSGAHVDDGDAFYKAAREIDEWIAPGTVNEEMWAAVGRWNDAQSKQGEIA